MTTRRACYREIAFRVLGVLAVAGGAVQPACLAERASAQENSAQENGVSEPMLPEAVRQAEEARIAAIAKAVPASVSVFARGGGGGGSGVVISPDGYALTNFHVVKPAGNAMKCSMPDGRLYDAVIVGIDPTGDVAVIKLLGRDDFPSAEMADSDAVRVGDACFAVGNPFLLATDFQPTVTWGVVSGVNRYQYPAGTLLEYADCIQTDASINPGNSGGPLFDGRGRLIGINGRGSFEKRGRVNVGVGYAISINQIKHFLGYLKSGRIVDHATLGATVATDETGRVLVSNILESSDAYRRGLRYGDEIVAFGGRPIGTVNMFKNVLGIYPKGWRVPLTYQREGERFDVLVRLAGVHSTEELIQKVQGGGAPEGRPRPGGPRPAPERPGEEPPNDEAPPHEGEPEGEAPREIPPGGDPVPVRPVALPRALPREVAPFFEARPGYANFYFNKLNRDRVWEASQQHGDFTSGAEQWTLEGELAGLPVRWELNSAGVKGEWDKKPHTLDAAQDLDGQLAPPGSGGLLGALHLWHRLLTRGPNQFGEVYYLGTAPLAGRAETFDVLVATHNVAETRCFFDPAEGRLVGMEMYPDRDVDPCELLFSDYREISDGRELPHRIEVRVGDQLFGVMQLRSAVVRSSEENPS